MLSNTNISKKFKFYRCHVFYITLLFLEKYLISKIFIIILHMKLELKRFIMDYILAATATLLIVILFFILDIQGIKIVSPFAPIMVYQFMSIGTELSRAILIGSVSFMCCLLSFILQELHSCTICLVIMSTTTAIYLLIILA